MDPYSLETRTSKVLLGGYNRLHLTPTGKYQYSIRFYIGDIFTPAWATLALSKHR